LRFKGFDSSWNISAFIDHFINFSTNSLSWDFLNFNSGEIKNLHYGLIHSSKYSVFNSCNAPFINKDSIPKKYTIYKSGDLILADTSEDKKDVGKALELVLDNYPIICGLHTMHFRERKPSTIPFYKSYYFSSMLYQHFTHKYSEGVKVFSLKPSLYKYFTFSYPCKDEQQKIVSFLRLIDNKIEIIENKIDILKKYKKGQIQKLIRKTVFTDYYRLSDVCKIDTGKLDANQMVADGKYKFFTCSRDDFYINHYAFDCEAILVSGNGDVGFSKYFKGKFNAYQRTYVLHNFLVNAKFVKIIFDNNVNKIVRKETNIGAMPYIRKSTFDKVLIPKIKKESIEYIVSIYDSLNYKIDSLEAKLSLLKSFCHQLLNDMFI